MKFGTYDPLEVVLRYEASFFEPDKTKEFFKFAYNLFEEHIFFCPAEFEVDVVWRKTSKPYSGISEMGGYFGGGGMASGLQTLRKKLNHRLSLRRGLHPFIL